MLGLVYFQSKRNPDEAIQAYKQSLKLSAPSAEILNDLADVYLAQGRGNDAEQVLRQVLRGGEAVVVTGLGLIGLGAMGGIARQPEQAGTIRTAMLIIGGLVEGAGIIGLVFCLVAG